MNIKIREKVIGMMVLLIIIPIISLGWSSYDVSSKMSKKQYMESGAVIGEQAKVLVENNISETNMVL